MDQVDAGCLPDDDAVLALCHALAKLLGREQDEGRGLLENGKDAAPRAEFHALERGPILMGKLGEASAHPADLLSGKHLIQGMFQEGAEEDFTVMRPKDMLKLKKQNERAEKVQRAAYAAHQAQVLAAMKGKKITINRNTGGAAVRDIHLEQFSVSNGGQELISDASLTLAWGHKYGGLFSFWAHDFVYMKVPLR